MARPTKLTPELLDRAKNYIEEYTTAIPTVAGLALYLDISRETIYDWDKEQVSDVFSDILGKVKSLQEQELVDNGLKGEFNSTITKLMLTKHGYSDKQEIQADVRGKIIAPLGGESVNKGDKDGTKDQT